MTDTDASDIKADRALAIKDMVALLTKAQKLRSAGDTLTVDRLRSELEEIFSVADDPLKDNFTDRIRTRDDLERCAKAIRPLKSKFCRGNARHAIRRCLKALGSRLLASKGIVAGDPIVGLNKRRLRPEDHEAIRQLITEQVLPFHAARVPIGAPKNLDMQTAMLALGDLFLRYAPPRTYSELPEADLPAGRGTVFNQFLGAAFRFHDPDTPKELGDLAEFWEKRLAIMTAGYVKAPKTA
ncbi:MAG: hypothetical protein NXI19_21005 [Alphaproteobacteria bacterium]|nr:hypothetical protein [Alphaproteobacteria bacterium]